MPLYLCRWPNGDCSVVWARNTEDAIIKLDEVGNAEGCPLVRLPELQVHFTLTDDGRIVYQSMGEETADHLMTMAYPHLTQVLSEVYEEDAPPDGERFTPEQAAKVSAAVIHERHRVHLAAEEIAEPDTELGQHAKRQTGMATVLVNRIVRDTATQILKGFTRKGKPH